MWPRFLRSQSSLSSPSSPPSPPTTGTPPDPAYRSSVSDNDEERNLTNRIRFFTTDRLRRHPSVNMSLNFVGSPDFQPPPAQPAQARHSSNTRRSRATSLAGSVDQRLSVIDEDHPSPPLDSPTPINPKTHNRPFSRRFGLGEPPRYSSSNRPPNYTFWDITGPKGEKFDDLRNNVRNNAYVAKRGGWKRICIIFWVLLVLVIALAVGLGVGLMRRHHNRYDLSFSTEPGHNTYLTSSSSKPAPSPSASASPQTGPFPAGSYTFTTFLSSTSTNCTSNPASWTCQPSVTYSSDPISSKAQFNWIISTTNSTPVSSTPNFTISSTSNPFSIDFTNASLSLLDAGLDTERYSFKTIVPKIVYPTDSLSIKCFYNETQFSGNLYTKKPKTVPSGAAASATSSASAAASTGDDFGEWKFAVDATQSIGGGVDVPDCYQYNNGQTGAKLTKGYEEKDEGQFCSCAYKNDNP